MFYQLKNPVFSNLILRKKAEKRGFSTKGESMKNNASYTAQIPLREIFLAKTFQAGIQTHSIADLGLRIADLFCLSTNPQSEIRNPKSLHCGATVRDFHPTSLLFVLNDDT